MISLNKRLIFAFSLVLLILISACTGKKDVKASLEEIRVGTDGIVINPISYDVEQGQKTLYKYARKEGLRIEEFKQEEEKVKEVDEIIEERQTELGNDAPEDAHEENT